MINSFSEIAPLTTVRLTAHFPGPVQKHGTGFFFAYRFPERGEGVFAPFIATNKHVIADALQITCMLHRGDGAGNPVGGPPVPCTMLPMHSVPHPDPDVDLVLLPIAQQMAAIEAAGTMLAINCLSEEMLPPEGSSGVQSAIAEVLVTGYPLGIIDAHNNSPITRRGITATDPRNDYNGKAQFLIDMHILPGSSGSPVIVNQEGIINEGGAIMIGRSRTTIIGVVFATIEFAANGKVVQEAAPTAVGDLVSTPAYAQLGVCLKASRLRELKPIVAKMP